MRNLKIREVVLRGGRFDGAISLTSGSSTWIGGELYVEDGHESTMSFIHAKTALDALPLEQRETEKKRVQEWMRSKGREIRIGNEVLEIPPPLSDLIGIPPWRVHAWKEAITNALV